MKRADKPESPGLLVKLADLALQVRRDSLRMIANAGAGHPGGALGAAEILAVLYGRILEVSPDRLEDPDRNRFVLSNGHICAAWYSVLARTGFLLLEELATFRRLGSRLQGHPARVHLPALVETSSGPLGQGFSVANGLALAKRLDRSGGRVFCLVGDGEMQEGQVWEALLTAAHQRLANLTLIVTYNGLQIDGEVERIKNLQPLADKLKAFSFQVQEVDGHDLAALLAAFRKAASPADRPKAIIARTIMSKGVPFMEDRAAWHGACPDAEQLRQALEILGPAQGYRDFPIPGGAA